MTTDYEKTGYLDHDFKIFHLLDNSVHEFSYHYHDFHKILIFLSGNATYHVEGKSYQLQPLDIVLVRAGELHRPEVNGSSPYERIIFYVSKDFLDNYTENEQSLNLMFTNAAANNSSVLRIASFKSSRTYEICQELVQSMNSTLAFHELYQKTLFLEFMIHLNRLSTHNHAHYIETDSCNEKILSILTYINSHLTSDITAESLAGQFYLSKYYLMHIFKEETGYSIGGYLATKRLLYARTLIESGMPVTQACYACGYRNYSTFSRAYKKLFSQSASSVRKR